MRHKTKSKHTLHLSDKEYRAVFAALAFVDRHVNVGDISETSDCDVKEPSVVDSDNAIALFRELGG